MNDTPLQTEALYRAAVGEKAAPYYLPRFQRFDEHGRRPSWNWPALFVPFFWLLYRRMYALAFAYLILWPLALTLFASMTMVLLGEDLGTMAYFAAVLGVRFMAIPMYANALYHRHVQNEIRKLSATAPSHEALVQRLIGRGATAGSAAVIAIAAVGGIVVIGILAAIAVPAYQDYTIRAQVASGLSLATPIKEALATAYFTTGTWPPDLPTLGLDPADYRGAYVAAIEVIDGSILIHYGNTANRLIDGGTVALHPVSAAGNDVEWSCGYSHAFAGDEQPWTSIAPKYLPAACRAPASR